MAVMIKCKMCGGDLLLAEGSTIATCDYCGTQQTVPTADNDKKLSLFTRANKLRFACDFDKAAGIYESIAAEFPDEAEGYWGLVLCKYGIEYVDDPATGKKIPTCHCSSFDSVMEDTNFEQALENADALSRKIYREEAKQIEQLRKGIIAVSAKEAPYDIFICYKETAEDGQRTVDSVLAQDIYDALTQKGYRVFFSRITLEEKLGQEYEPFIFAALNSAKVMLAIGTDYEHFNAVWVKNEWSRFLKLMEKDNQKYLIPCFKGIDAYDLPKEFSKLQAQDLGKVGAMQDLLRGVDKLIAAKPLIATAEVQSEDLDRVYLYNSAREAIDSSSVKKAAEAVEKLSSLGDYKDAPELLEKARQNLKKRKNQCTIRRAVAVLLVIAIIGGIVGYNAYTQRQANKATYEMAMEYVQTENYLDAYAIFVDLEEFADAPQKAEQMQKLMEATAGELIRNAQMLYDYGLYRAAGYYLNRATNQANSVTETDREHIRSIATEYIDFGQEVIDTWYETIPNAMWTPTGQIMEAPVFVESEFTQSVEFDNMLAAVPVDMSQHYSFATAVPDGHIRVDVETFESVFDELMQQGDLAGIFAAMVETSIADSNMSPEYLYKIVEKNVIANVTLEELMGMVPQQMIPPLDSALGGENGNKFIDSCF